MMRLLATLGTAALVVWGANQAAERVDPELWRAPAAAARDGLIQALAETKTALPEREREPNPEPPTPAEVSDAVPPVRTPFIAEHVPSARGVKEPVEPALEVAVNSAPAPLTRAEAERIRDRLERVMQLAHVGDR